jgi:cytochrome P450
MITNQSLVAEVDALYKLRQDLVDDPYPLLQRLREESPVLVRNQVATITRYEDIETVLREAKLFSAQRYDGPRVKSISAGMIPEARATFDRVVNYQKLWMSAFDPPEHTRLRTIVHKVFTPRRVAEMRPRIVEITNRIVEEIRGRDQVEIVHDFAYGLPLYVIASMLGSPPEDWPNIRNWSSALAAFQGTLYANHAEVAAALDAFNAYVHDLIEERRKSEHTDLLAALLAAEVEGDRLSTQELEAMFVLLLFAGHETTTNLISNGLYRLVTHPDQLARLRSDPTLIVSAVEELLRYDTNVSMIDRVAAEDIELSGTVVPKGTAVFAWISAANRDPSRFEKPDELDITRADNRHLGFSIGPHYCLGQALARMEAQVAIGTFVKEFPDFQLVPGEDLHWRKNLQQRRIISVPVTLN